MVVLLGLWALYQGLHTESVLKKSLYAYTIYSAALTPVILAAFYWRRATASAAVASIFTGTFVTVFWDSAFIHAHLPAVIAERDAIFPALLAACSASSRQPRHRPPTEPTSAPSPRTDAEPLQLRCRLTRAAF